MKKKVYISGSITADIKTARLDFAKKEAELLQKGYQPVNPFKNGLSDDDPWEKHLATDILSLLGCDYIVMLPGWKNSRGATLEHEIAVLKNIPELKI